MAGKWVDLFSTLVNSCLHYNADLVDEVALFTRCIGILKNNYGELDFKASMMEFTRLMEESFSYELVINEDDIVDIIHEALLSILIKEVVKQVIYIYLYEIVPSKQYLSTEGLFSYVVKDILDLIQL